VRICNLIVCPSFAPFVPRSVFDLIPARGPFQLDESECLVEILVGIGAGAGSRVLVFGATTTVAAEIGNGHPPCGRLC
jgi:hypothetical protein